MCFRFEQALHFAAEFGVARRRFDSDTRRDPQQEARTLPHEPIAREVMAIDSRQRPDHLERYLAESLLGARLLGQKQFAEAESHLLAGFGGIEARTQKIDASDRYRVAKARLRIVQLSKKWGKPQQAKAWEAAH